MLLLCLGLSGEGEYYSEGVWCWNDITVGSKELLVYITAESLGRSTTCLLRGRIQSSSDNKVIGFSVH